MKSVWDACLEIPCDNCANIAFTGKADLSDVLSSLDDQIAKAKEEAIDRKDILDKVEKWHYASEEEKWLDEYEKDENRYSAGRGAHKNLKRAEKARILKRLQDQFAAEQEAIFGSKPATKRPLGPNTTTNMVGTPIGRRVMTPLGRNTNSGGKDRRESGRVANPIPLNYVALPKDDPMSRGV
ncbi:hypothetical protein LWI28_000727 [Acer negundo]|uniref:Uncharacterized protein n=1 Tax=Acer negundo TaxID=4023 RepID=A0AAD5I8S6_ACENE|nr:hypothetical protein LWI28_000727 [Acer negundo]